MRRRPPRAPTADPTPILPPSVVPTIQTADTLLLEHRRLVVQANDALTRRNNPVERLALTDELINLIERLDTVRRTLADSIRRGRAASSAASAYGRAGVHGRAR